LEFRVASVCSRRHVPPRLPVKSSRPLPPRMVWRKLCHRRIYENVSTMKLPKSSLLNRLLKYRPAMMLEQATAGTI
jgi:hypothetical protein